MATFKDKPAASDILATSQVDLQGNFEYLQASLNKDHKIVFNDTDATSAEGRHRKVSLIDLGVQGFPGDGTTAMIYATAGQIYFINTVGGPYQLTNSSSAVGSQARFGTDTEYGGGGTNIFGGWTFLPGGLIMQYGELPCAANPGQTPVTYPIAFPSGQAAFNIQVTAKVSSSSGDLSAAIRSFGDASSFIISTSSDGKVTDFHWVAIGK